jgi:hypothetical protein
MSVILSVVVAIVARVSTVRVAALRRNVSLMARPANVVTLLGVVSGGSTGTRMDSTWTVGGMGDQARYIRTSFGRSMAVEKHNRVAYPTAPRERVSIDGKLHTYLL